MSKALAIIPSRKGSKRLKDKNTKMLCGKPMIEYTLESVIKSKYIKTAIITSDDNKVKEIWKKYRHSPAVDMKFHRRPKHLRGDDVPMIDVIQDVIKSYPSLSTFTIVLLQPTSPLRTAHDIDDCIKEFDRSGFSSIVTVKKTLPITFVLNGAVFVTNKDLINEGKIWDNFAGLVIMPYERSVDVDRKEDFELCEMIMEMNNDNYS